MKEWSVENIPDTSFLYRRVHPKQIRRGKAVESAFGDYDLSVDWDKYSTPEKTLDRLPQRINRTSWGVARIAAKIPESLKQNVTHRPSLQSNNRAHALIKGKKTLEVSECLSEMSTLVIG